MQFYIITEPKVNQFLWQKYLSCIFFHLWMFCLHFVTRNVLSVKVCDQMCKKFIFLSQDVTRGDRKLIHVDVSFIAIDIKSKHLVRLTDRNSKTSFLITYLYFQYHTRLKVSYSQFLLLSIQIGSFFLSLVSG